MLRVYLTIDTEYSSGRYARSRASEPWDDFASAIEGVTPDGAVGIYYQMDVLERFGLKAVFFVDPLPALVWGNRAVAAIVEPIVKRGHDVQLHLHTEWLAFADSGVVGGKTGANIKDFTYDEQVDLLGLARELLIEAGAPPPVCFRAGNYGANDDTLRALAALDIGYDTSACPGIPASACAIDLPANRHSPHDRLGVIEVPIGSIAGYGDRRRHAQITALSAWEMTAAIDHARRQQAGAFTIVSHSFELLSRDRRRINPIVRRRFEKLCASIAAMPDVMTGTYADTPPQIGLREADAILAHNPLRTAHRMFEQAMVNLRYGDKR